jgi:sugar lactone lactonase YvrE
LREARVETVAPQQPAEAQRTGYLHAELYEVSVALSWGYTTLELMYRPRMLGLASVLACTLVSAFTGGCGGGAPAIGSGAAASAFATKPSQQKLYVPEFSHDLITTYRMDGTPTTPTISQGLDGPNAVAVDDNGKIYVTNDYIGEVSTYNPDGSETTPTISGLHNPYGIAVDKHGKIYVVNSGYSSCGGGSVTTYLPDGTPTTPTISILGSPVGIAVDALGKIWVSNACAGPSGQGEVTTYKPDGTPTTPTLTDQQSIDEPLGIAIVDDTLYVANSFGIDEGYITKYRLNGEQVPPLISDRVEGAESVAVDASGKIFVVNALAGFFGSITSYLPNGTKTRPSIRKGIHQPGLIAIR